MISTFPIFPLSSLFSLSRSFSFPRSSLRYFPATISVYFLVSLFLQIFHLFHLLTSHASGSSLGNAPRVSNIRNGREKPDSDCSKTRFHGIFPVRILLAFKKSILIGFGGRPRRKVVSKREKQHGTRVDEIFVQRRPSCVGDRELKAQTARPAATF